MNRHWTLGLAIAGFVVAVIMSITLLVLWNVYIIDDVRTIAELARDPSLTRPGGGDPSGRWIVLAMGSSFFAVILIALSLFFASYLVNRRYRRIQTDWLSMTTHELKLPTANIQLFAQTMQRPNLAEADRVRFTGLIVQEARRLDGLVSRILQARRIEGGMEDLRPENIAVVPWLRSCQARPASPAFEIEGTFEGRIRVDRRQLETILDNLVHNAHKYGDGSNPRVVVSLQGTSVSIEVRDRGIGIPPQVRKKVFRRFYRVPTREHRRRTGTGLGLYIARSLVVLMGGTMGVSDNPDGKGTSFWMRFPVVR
ncbi:MAG: HAMP domain-containing histidine kinase [Fibrobacteria bacterium]|nr:HAMP domain-containing histidine kinase [Fibrobacteria bacterium]